MQEIKSIIKALKVLEVLRKSSEPLSLATLHRELDISKSTLVRILNTLEAWGYIEKDHSLKNYTLGIELLKYASSVAERISVKQVSAPVLKRLRDACGETVYIYMLHKNRRICVDCLPGKSPVRLMVYVGQESPLYAAASGKVILAYFSEDELKQYFEEIELLPLTNDTIIERDKLLQDLSLIRQCGYAVSFGEKVCGAICVSAPVWDRNGKVIASLSIGAPLDKKSEINNYIKLVKDGAEEISEYNRIETAIYNFK